MTAISIVSGFVSFLHMLFPDLFTLEAVTSSNEYTPNTAYSTEESRQWGDQVSRLERLERGLHSHRNDANKNH